MRRRSPRWARAATAGLTFAFWDLPSIAWSHGLTGRSRLPLPLWMASYGAAAVLVISFVALALLGPRPRLEGGVQGVVLPGPVRLAARALEWPLRLVGLAGFLLVWLVALFGPLSAPQNLAPWVVFIWLWVGGLVLSGLAGDLWQVLSPFETAILGVGAEVRHDGTGGEASALERLGVWPAAAMLLGFVWLELVYPDPSEPRTLGLAITLYTSVLAVGATWFGAAWIRAAEPFGVLFRIMAAMAPVHHDGHGRLRLRPPLAGLADLEILPGTAAVILVALGSTTFDGVSRLAAWERLIGQRTGWVTVPFGTLGLVLSIALVSGLYAWSMREAARRTNATTAELLDRFVHSLVPIVFAYGVAHYFSLLVLDGQRALILASDPFGRGWDVLGTAEWSVDYTLVSARTIALVQATSIVAGHVAGVVVAHDRAVAMFDVRQATRSQYALLVAMISYTVGGLVLLLGG